MEVLVLDSLTILILLKLPVYENLSEVRLDTDRL
jgi:hypothetical protein